jgi:hypothetical protein
VFRVRDVNLFALGADVLDRLDPAGLCAHVLVKGSYKARAQGRCELRVEGLVQLVRPHRLSRVEVSEQGCVLEVS